MIRFRPSSTISESRSTDALRQYAKPPQRRHFGRACGMQRITGVGNARMTRSYIMPIDDDQATLLKIRQQLNTGTQAQVFRDV